MTHERTEDPEIRAHVREMAKAHGVAKAAEMLGVRRTTIMAYLADTNMHDGTRALLELAVYRQRGTRGAF